VYLRPQGDLRLILNTNVAVNMLRNQADLFKKILETLTHLQVCKDCWNFVLCLEAPIQVESNNLQILFLQQTHFGVIVYNGSG
jgi:hypothetical protein